MTTSQGLSLIATVILAMTPNFSQADQKEASTNEGNGPPAVHCGAGEEYIQSGLWIYRYNEWSLSLVPSTCGRQIGSDETALMFYEIAKKFAGSPYWSNTRGMINQLTCHLVIARNKPEWNLDPWRPYVGHNATVAAGCNVTEPDPDTPFH